MNCLRSFTTNIYKPHFLHKLAPNVIWPDLAVKSSSLISGYNYIGSSEIFFKHNKCPYKIVVTTDRQQVIDGNKLDNKNSTVFWYMSDGAVQEIIKTHDRPKILKCINELNQWKFIDEFSSSFRTFLLGLSRVTSQVDLPFNQYVFATKHLSFAFIVDDVLEKLSSKVKWNLVCEYMLDSLCNILKSNCTIKPDMNVFKGQMELPDKLIHDAQRALIIQQELMTCGKDILHPNVYEFFLQQSIEFMEFIRNESKNFAKACEEQKFFTRKEILRSRLITIGDTWTYSSMITDPKTIQYMDPYNPFVVGASWSTTCDNDVIGYYRDASIQKFTPVQLVRSLVQSGIDDIDAGKMIANESNMLKMNLEHLLELMPDHIRIHYHNFWMLVNGYIDFHFVLGNDELNTRYGWYPVKK